VLYEALPERKKKKKKQQKSSATSAVQVGRHFDNHRLVIATAAEVISNLNYRLADTSTTTGQSKP
jgi:hypothetical protein